MCIVVTTETFIERARLVHMSKYDYSCVVYRKVKEKGYNIKYIWETDWLSWNRRGPLPIKEY
jgi:hypothetical protein